MRQQSLTFWSTRGIVSGTEYDMGVNRVGQSVDVSRRLLGIPVRMHADITELSPEPRLKEGAGGRSQRLSRRGQHRADRCRRLTTHAPLRLPRHRHPFVLTRRAKRPTDGASRTLPLDKRRRHPHDLIGHPIGFLLIWIAWFTDGQFGLEEKRKASGG